MALSCRADLETLTNWEKPCGTCITCRPESALKYPFQKDLKNSNGLVEEIRSLLFYESNLYGIDTDTNKNPDILVYTEEEKLIARIEAKYLEGKAFMKVASMIKEPLFPKETIVLDEPKLLSYFECQERDKKTYSYDIPIYIVWKLDRPCADIGGICIYQNINELKKIYELKHDMRAFTRKTGNGDYVNGRQLGVTAKFHFSITECLPIEKLIIELNKIKGGN